ncbi:MAG: recombinase family protein [Candidatus Omnitrophica bacterium]|nr:recombinase family protein [Candidatus Omnitrophota bacterium]
MDKVRVAIYARCSTDESRQDVESQINACKRYCETQGWSYEIFQEYESAYKGAKRKAFEEALERTRLREFNILMVYMLDRFSRETPTKIVSDLHRIVEEYGCRFISIKEGIDSNNDMWQIIMMIFAYMANNYSKMLGIRVKDGIRQKKEKGLYEGGRREKEIDLDRLKAVTKQKNLGLRKIAQEYNRGLAKKDRISYGKVRRVLQKPLANSKGKKCQKSAVI